MIGVAEHGRAVPRIVRVAGDEVHQVAMHQVVGHGFGGASEVTQQRSRGHLHQRAIFHPGLQLIETRMQQRVALGVRDDRRQAGAHQAVEDLLCGAGNQQIGELHQQITEVVDGILPWVGQGILNILERQVEVAAAVDAGDGSGGILQFGDFPADQVRVEGELRIGVRRGDDVGGAGTGGQVQHGDGIFEGPGAVVEAGQDMAVDIDQP